MDPAFSSVRQAAAFALLLLVLLLSPLIAGKSGLPARDQIYSSIPWRTGSFPYLHREIFEEKGDIDIAFMGSSHMNNDIDTVHVQEELSKALGRPATVRSLCWANPGFDTFYFVAKDLLEHRKVRMIVFYDDRASDQPHISSWRWIRYEDDGAELAGLPLGVRISYYYGSILGLPRNLLNRTRPNIPADLVPDFFFRDYSNAFFPPDHLGSFVSQVSYDNRRDLFRPYSPVAVATPADVCVYSADTSDKFTFSADTGKNLQTYFAQKFLALAKEHSTHLVCLNLPVFSEKHDMTISEGRLWIDTFKDDAPLLGIAPGRLFTGLTDDDICNLYQDSVHLNQNGQAYFTRIITPQLTELYEEAKP